MHKYFWPAIIGLLLWMLLGSYFLACDDCNPKPVEQVFTETPVAAPKVELTLENVFIIVDGDKFNTGASEHFTFANSGFVPNIPETTKIAFDKIADYLNGNERSLLLTGYYTNDEQVKYENDPGKTYDNIGLARAHSIKDYFTAKGVAANRILTSGFEEYTLDYNAENLLPYGVKFKFSGAEDLEALKTRLVKPLNVYFQSGSDRITLDDELKSYFADLKIYTETAEGAEVSVVGHTDSDGGRNGNIRLSKKRANLIKDFMIRQGIKSSSITNVDGKGPDEPIADNNTSEGKAQNRRVEIRIKN